MDTKPKISIVVPTSDAEGKKFLPRCLESIEIQTYKNYEVIITKEGKVAHNLNCGIKKATGDIIKILCDDDYFNGETALEELVSVWEGGWLASGCIHNREGETGWEHYPQWNDKIHKGFNSIGGLSVLAFENKDPLLFTEGLDWMLDVDFYKRAFLRYGLPRFLVTPNVVIGVGPHQLTNNIPQEQKIKEINLMIQTYGE